MLVVILSLHSMFYIVCLPLNLGRRNDLSLPTDLGLACQVFLALTVMHNSCKHVTTRTYTRDNRLTILPKPMQTLRGPHQTHAYNGIEVASYFDRSTLHLLVFGTRKEEARLRCVCAAGQPQMGLWIPRAVICSLGKPMGFVESRSFT